MEFARLAFMSTANVWPRSSDTAARVLLLVECVPVVWREDEGDTLYVSILHAHTHN